MCILFKKNCINSFIMVSVLTAIFILFSCNKEELLVEQTILPDDDATEVPKEETLDPEDNDDENISVVLLEEISVETFENTPVVIDLFSEGIDIPTDFILSFGDLSNGTISVDDKGSSGIIKDDIITYIPNTGFSGMETFQYSVCNPLNPENCGVAMVTINVNPKLSIEDSFETELKAFPTAYGGGAMATGGRGGKVIHVTNLNNSGTGSFREAVSQPNRIIVFDVSGTINLTSSLTITADNLTIAGQTAPAGGITLCGKQIRFNNANNIIIRYVRVRQDYTSAKWGEDDTTTFYGSNNVILDHCSFSWGADETLTFYGSANNITIQRCMLGEGKTASIFGDSGDASLGSNLSYLSNVIYNTTHRTPNINLNSRADVINNVIFNWKYRLSRLSGRLDVNFINNYYALGCLSSISKVGNMILSGSPKIYASGNYIDKGILTNPLTDNWLLFQNFSDGSLASVTYKSTNPFPQIGSTMPVMSAIEAFQVVTNDSGANAVLDAYGNKIEGIDVVDNVYKTNINNGNCISYNSSSDGANYDTTTHWKAFWASVSSTPIASHSSTYDTDKDGMPDLWEKAMFGDLARDGTGDLDGDGYTDLEEFLNGVDKQL